VYGDWVGKVSGTLDLPWEIRVTPVFRVVSGVAFARTFLARLNYNTAVAIKVEPVGADRGETVSVFDVRGEKNFAAKGSTFGVFFDVYNILNTNDARSVTSSSGNAFRRPTAIPGPRIARIGAKFRF
jgi:hypothetical protein